MITLILPCTGREVVHQAKTFQYVKRETEPVGVTSYPIAFFFFHFSREPELLLDHISFKLIFSAAHWSEFCGEKTGEAKKKVEQLFFPTKVLATNIKAVLCIFLTVWSIFDIEDMQ